MLGANRTHLQSFNLFLAAVIALSLLTVGIFVLTAAREAPDSAVDSPHS